jgi:hypothetical protein
MIEFDEFAAQLARNAVASERELLFAADKIGLVQKKLAQDEIIGHELPMWPPLAESTVEDKEFYGYVDRVSETDPLLRTGEMRDSIDYSVRPLLGVGVEVTLGSADKVAIYQELGTPTIPARPFLTTATMAAMDEADKILGDLAVALITPPKR